MDQGNTMLLHHQLDDRQLEVRTPYEVVITFNEF